MEGVCICQANLYERNGNCVANCGLNEVGDIQTKTCECKEGYKNDNRGICQKLCDEKEIYN